MFLQRDNRTSQPKQTSRLTSANLQAHVGSLASQNSGSGPFGRSFNFGSFVGFHGEPNLGFSPSRQAFLRPDRFDLHRGALRSNNDSESDSNGRGTPDSVAAIHGTQADDDLESTITSASRFLAEAGNNEEPRSFFDPYGAENAPQTPGSVYTVASSIVSSNCDTGSDAVPFRVFGDLSTMSAINDNPFRIASENRNAMRNQAENVIDTLRTHHHDVTNSAWSSSSAAMRSTTQQQQSQRRELTSQSQSQSFASGGSRKRPFLADADYSISSNDFDAAYDVASKRTLYNTQSQTHTHPMLSTNELLKRSNSQQPGASFKSMANEREGRHAADLFLTPPVISTNPFLYTTSSSAKSNGKNAFVEHSNDGVSTCAGWAPAPSPAPPAFSSSNWNRTPLFGSSSSSKQVQHFQQSSSNSKDSVLEDSFTAPASPPSPFKQPSHVTAGNKGSCRQTFGGVDLGQGTRHDLDAKFKEYQRNNSLIEKFGLRLTNRGSHGLSEDASGTSKSHGLHQFDVVNEFISQYSGLMQKRVGHRADKKSSKDGREEMMKDSEGASRIGIQTSELLELFSATHEFKKPDVYRTEAKRLKHLADSVTSASCSSSSGPSDVQNLMTALVKIGTYTEAVLVFVLCAAAMESKPKRYKPEQCAEFYAGLLPLVQYVRQLAQTYQASRSPNEEEYSGDTLADLLFFGVHSMSYLIDSYLHLKMFEARKSLLETNLHRIDQVKSSLRAGASAATRICNIGELSDSGSNMSTSSGYMSNLSSPLIHRNASRSNVPATSRNDLHDHDERNNYTKDRSEDKARQSDDVSKYEFLSEQYETALRDMALVCRAFDLREEAFDLVRKIRTLNVVSEGEHKRKWKHIVKLAKWPPFSVQHSSLDELIVYVRMFASTLMSTVLSLLKQQTDLQQGLRKKR